MAKAYAMTIGIEGVEVAIEYNAANLRVTQVSWILLAGYTCRARIWNSGALVVDRSAGGPEVGAESIPGNLRMVYVDDPPGQGYYDLPPNITWTLSIQSIG